MINRRKLTKADKESLIKMRGNRCFNCQTTENIEWHHVVPLEIGGEDSLHNMVPLCYACHKAVTNHELLLATFGREHKSGGRSRKIPENYKDILWQYIRCDIGKKECIKLLGLSEQNRLTDNVWFKEFLEGNGIERYKNNIDLRIGQGRKMEPDSIVGWMCRIGGEKECFTWNQPYKGAEPCITK